VGYDGLPLRAPGVRSRIGQQDRLDALPRKMTVPGARRDVAARRRTRGIGPGPGVERGPTTIEVADQAPSGCIASQGPVRPACPGSIPRAKEGTSRRGDPLGTEPLTLTRASRSLTPAGPRSPDGLDRWLGRPETQPFGEGRVLPRPPLRVRPSAAAVPGRPGGSCPSPRGPVPPREPTMRHRRPRRPRLGRASGPAGSCPTGMTEVADGRAGPGYLEDRPTPEAAGCPPMSQSTHHLAPSRKMWRHRCN